MTYYTIYILLPLYVILLYLNVSVQPLAATRSKPLIDKVDSGRTVFVRGCWRMSLFARFIVDDVSTDVMANVAHSRHVTLTAI